MKEKYLQIGQSALLKEIKGLENLKSILDENFSYACQLIQESTGKVILVGIGKSGLIAHKIAATMSSTGTPALFLNAAEGSHGDLGVIEEKDIVVLISNSGSTQEVLNLLPSIKRIGSKTISITSKKESQLAQQADIHLWLGVFEEACHLKLAPTTSTTLTLALGDALAVTVSQIKDFKESSYAVFHPGGVLGKKLLLTVNDVMQVITNEMKAEPNEMLETVISNMVASSTGGIVVCDNDTVVGVVTDGDIKRIISKHHNDFLSIKAQEVMTKSPITIESDCLVMKALDLMQGKDREISFLPVIQNNKLVGIIKLSDILKIGLKRD